jgi:hypothetical protein
MTSWWTQKIELNNPAGETLRKLAEILPKTRPLQITLFGSAPLQLSIDPTLLSGDVDIFSDEEFLADAVERAGLSEKQHKPGFHVCSELNFRTSPRWKDRVRSIQIENVTFIVPHPYDILIAKLNRLEEKDLLAFRTVIAKTGHPTGVELIHELQLAVDLFRPSFDEEQGHDMADNCRRLWPLIYGREIDPRAEIIAPALAIRKAGYGEPTRDYKQELRDALKE